MEEQSELNQAKISGASREKTWAEKTDTEKMEAMRREIQSMSYNITSIREMCEGLIRHEHGHNGMITVPLLDNRNEPFGYRNRVPLE